VENLISDGKVGPSPREVAVQTASCIANTTRHIWISASKQALRQSQQVERRDGWMDDDSCWLSDGRVGRQTTAAAVCSSSDAAIPDYRIIIGVGRRRVSQHPPARDSQTQAQFKIWIEQAARLRAAPVCSRATVAARRCCCCWSRWRRVVSYFLSFKHRTVAVAHSRLLLRSRRRICRRNIRWTTTATTTAKW